MFVAMFYQLIRKHGAGVFLGLLGTGLLLGGFSGQTSAAADIGYQDFSYPSGTGGNSEPTGEKPESKLWWNDGAWWGSLWSTAGDAYHIYRFDKNAQTWTDTGVPIDDRSNTRGDALWDGQKLYVLSHVFGGKSAGGSSGTDPIELYRYSYNGGVYSLDPGFPIVVANAKPETAVLEKDGAGRLWITYVANKSVMANHSLNSDTNWDTPFALPMAEANNLNSDDISSIIAYKNHIGIMWSNQSSRPYTMYFAVHPASAAPNTTWTPVAAYTVSGDDHISLKSLEADSSGDVFAVVKTDQSSALIVTLVCKNNLNRCKNAADWDHYPVYTSSSGDPTRPILLIDQENRELYVFARTKDSGGNAAIRYKKSGLDNIQFADGLGTIVIERASTTKVNNPTSTKQNLNGSTGLLVLASDDLTRSYYHAYMELATGNAPVVSSFNPPSGAAGAEVTIAGLNFSNTTSVTFNGAAAVFAIDSDTQIGAVVPAGATTGPIQVANPAGSDSSGTNFVVTEPAHYNLTVNTVGPGSVAADPSGSVFNEGTAVTLSALPAPGYTFNGWSGDLTGSSNPGSITMNADKTVTATFVEQGGEVIFQGGQNGSSTSGSTVTTDLAVPAVSGEFYLAAVSTKPHQPVNAVSGLGLSWTALATQCGGRDQTGVDVWIGQGTPLNAEPVTAQLNGIPSSAVLTVSRYANVRPGSPSFVSANTNGIGGACSGGADSSVYSVDVQTFVGGSVVYGAVALRHRDHTPGVGYTERTEIHAGSGGGVTGLATEDRLVSSPVTAALDGAFGGNVDWAVVGVILEPGGTGPAQYTLTTNTAGSSQVTLDPPGGVYNAGTVVTLTAAPAAGWQFAGWSGDLGGAANPATLTMDSNKSVTATFSEVVPTQYTLTTSITGSGQVTLDPPGNVYNAGAVVTLTATPAAGWQFAGWSGDLSAGTNPAVLTMDRNKSVTATFSEIGGSTEIVLEEVKTGGSSGASSVTTSAPLAFANSNLYLAAVSTKAPVGIVNVSGLGLNWNRLVAQCAGRNQTGVEVWWTQGAPSGNGLVTATLGSAPVNAVIAVSRYSGVSSASPIGNIIAGNTNGLFGGCSGGADSAAYNFSLNTTVTGAVVYNTVAIRNRNHAPGAGFVEWFEVAQGGGGNMVGLAGQDKLVASAGLTAVDGSLSRAVDWAVIAVEIRPG